MATQVNLHPVQSKILKELLFKVDSRFSDLNIENLPNDHFSFHIKQLIREKLIQKTPKDMYQLTNKGKEFASRLDKETESVNEQGKIAVLIACIDTTKSETRFLVQQRLKQPHYGYHGFISGKVVKGSKIYDTADKQLLEETNLKAKLELIGIEHKMYYSSHNELLEDKNYFIFKAKNPTGNLQKEFKEGKNKWMTLKEIKKLNNLLPGINVAIKLIDNNNLTFSENKHIQDGY